MARTSSAVATRQAPLREAYRHDPAAAVTVKRVRTVGTPTTDAWHTTVVTATAPEVTWECGIDAKVGGYDDLPNPGHVLCAALAACLDSTLRMVADHLGVGIRHLEVEVTGDVDVRGCLAMDPTVRPGFRGLRCEIHLDLESDGDRSTARLAHVLLEQAERLCVTLDTLRNGVPIEVAAVTQREPPVRPAAR